MATATLRSRATLDDGPFQQGMGRMRGTAEKFGSGTMGVLSRRMAAVFSVAMVGRFAARQMQAADRTTDLANILGIQAEALQALEVSAEQYGGTLEQVQNGVKLLTRAQGEALSGSMGTARAFEALGLSMGDLGNMGTEQLLQAVSNGFKQAGGSAQALSAIQIVLGRSGMELAGVLSDIADNGLQGMIDKGKQAGTVLDNELIAKLAIANNQLEALTRQGGNWLTIVAANVAAGFADAFTMMGAITAVGAAEAGRQMQAGEIGTRGAAQKQIEAQREAAERQREMTAQQARASRLAQAEGIRAKRDQDVAGLMKSEAEQMAGIRVGAASAADTLAARGGFIGGQSSSMTQRIERMLAVAEINRATVQKIADLTAKAEESLAQIAESVGE